MSLVDAFTKEDRTEVKFSQFFALVKQAAQYETVMNAVNCDVPYRFIRETRRLLMTIDELKAAAKLRTRKMSADELDEDVFRYVDFVLADLKRIGVAEEYLKAPEDPLIIEAVLTYVKANYSMDANHERLMNSYNMILTKIKGGEYRSTQ